jgi:uncharacterized membrane-anchored protein
MAGGIAAIVVMLGLGFGAGFMSKAGEHAADYIFEPAIERVIEPNQKGTSGKIVPGTPEQWREFHDKIERDRKFDPEVLPWI